LGKWIHQSSRGGGRGNQRLVCSRTRRSKKIGNPRAGQGSPSKRQEKGVKGEKKMKNRRPFRRGDRVSGKGRKGGGGDVGLYITDLRRTREGRNLDEELWGGGVCVFWETRVGKRVGKEARMGDGNVYD